MATVTTINLNGKFAKPFICLGLVFLIFLLPVLAFANADSTLIKKAEQGDFEGVKAAIAAGADVNARDFLFNTPVLLIAAERSTKVARYLIENGADVNVKGEHGVTALMLSLYKPNPEYIKTFDARYAKSLIENPGFTYNSELTKLLIAKGADVNAKAITGETALMAASMRGYLDIVKLLIKNGAKVNAKSNYGQTSLMLSVYGDYVKVFKLLVKNGADMHIKNEEGTTLLMGASNIGSFKITKYLIKKGADVNAKNKKGETALMWACSEGHIDIVRLLIKKGADINAKDKNERTALNWAKEEDLDWTKEDNQAEIIDILTKAGEHKPYNIATIVWIAIGCLFVVGLIVIIKKKKSH